MINVSAACKMAIHENTKIILKGNIDFTDGEHMELSGADFMGNTFGLSQASSSTGSFEIGAAVIGKASFSLNNYDGKFDTFDFTDSIITIWVGVPLKNGLTEWIKKGVFTIEQPDTYGSTISLSAYDNLSKFEKPYSGVTTSFPATLQVILSDICLHCGVPIGFSQFDNYNFSIPARPDDSAMSCLDMVSYVAQIAGYFAMCDTDGRLKLKWYDMGVLDSTPLNGGVFDNASPYASGDNAYGGNFTDYSSGDDFFGGNFADEYINLYAFTDFSVCTDDVVITGIKVISQEDEEEISIYGTEDYVLTISGNPLITNKNKNLIATYLGQRTVGMRFRPFSLQAQADPAIEPGDCCYITDRKRNIYRSVITSLNYRIGSRESLSCNAETPGRNRADHHSQLSKTVTELRKNQKKELSNYDKQVQVMNRLAINAMGFYQTVEVNPADGSQIVYMHDKPGISDSKIIYKETIDGFFLSRDGGKTYIYGRDSNGNAIVNVLSAIGIICDWIKGGTLTLGGDNNVDGACTVLDAAGREVARLDKSGLKTNSAEITGGSINILTDSASSSVILIRSKSGSVNMYTHMGASGFSAYSSDYGSVDISVSGIILRNGGSTTLDINRSSIVLNEYGFSIKAYSGWSSVQFTDSSYITVRNNVPSISLGAFRLLQGSSDTLCEMRIGNVKISGGGDSGTSKINLGNIELYSASGGEACRLRNTTVEGFLNVTGTKSRIVQTKNYSERLLYCYETPKPYFGDIGEAVLDEDGLCYVFIDDIFYETINTECKYQIFLQKYGQGDIWIKKRAPTHFVAEGTPNLPFAWEIKARQTGFESERLETYARPEKEAAIDYGLAAQRYVENYYKEMLNYEESN